MSAKSSWTHNDDRFGEANDKSATAHDDLQGNHLNVFRFASLIFTALPLLLVACDKPQTGEEEKNSRGSMMSAPENVQESEEAGPPFEDSCLCSFNPIGKIQSNPKRVDLLFAGKGWNPQYFSCTWVFGELIENESIDDSMVTDLRIHLVDIDHLPEGLDSTFLSSTQFRENTIATHSKTGNDEYMTCKFDPNLTGKYPKPKQWIDD